MSKHITPKVITAEKLTHGGKHLSSKKTLLDKAGKQYKVRAASHQGPNIIGVVPVTQRGGHSFEKVVIADTGRKHRIVESLKTSRSNTKHIAAKGASKISAYKAAHSRINDSMSVYGKIYNQEEHDVKKAINSLSKYIK